MCAGQILLSASLCLAAESLGTQAPRSAGVSHSEDIALAKVGRHILTELELTSYTQLIEETGAPQIWGREEALQDYLLQRLLPETFTTVTAVCDSSGSVSATYPHLSQRLALKSALSERLRETIHVSK